MDIKRELKEKVINNDYCIGCGACAFLNNESIKMEKNSDGQLWAVIDFDKKTFNENTLNVCPFYNSKLNETVLGKELYESTKDINHDIYQGYYLTNYAGHVIKGQYREKGSSGGFGSWIAAKLLQEGLIDKVIHVKSSSNSDLLFEYQISNNLKEIQEGSKSRYYPIEMSKVLEYVKQNDHRYLFVGIPCFIKALRLLQKEDEILNERIKFTLGLVCGHLKSEFFAKSFGWELGIKPKDLKDIDFRIKLKNKPASSYGVKVTGLINDVITTIESPTRDLYVSSWGHGYFKYNACEYCDDVLAETADITIGDAWLPEYSKDSGGTNIIIIRNKRIDELFSKNREELEIEEISAEKIFQSQAGGFRHRRDALSYRLYLKELNNEWYPKKRVKPNEIEVTKKRRKIYDTRLKLREESFKNYHKAVLADDFNVFKKNTAPIVNEYNKIYRGNFIISFIKRAINKILRVLKLK